MIRGGRTDGGRRRKGEEGENARRMLELEGPTSGVAGVGVGGSTGASFLSFFFFFLNSRNRERDRDWAWYDCRVLETKKYEASSSLSSSYNERNCNESLIFFRNVLQASECII